jgi:hypothetical protein
MILRRLIIACLFASLVRTQERCAIEGTVTDSRSGAPIPNATLMLQGSGQPRVFASASDAEGKFALKDITPGPYRVTATAEGYARRSLQVRCGDPGYSLKFALSREAVISGRVAGDDGQPVPGARVILLRTAYVGGDKRFMTVGAATPNSDGEFRFDNLADGTYFAVASVPTIFVPTFYPSAIDPSAAAPIRIHGPGEIGGTDIRLRKERAFSIHGRLVPGDTVQSVRDFTIRLLPADPRGFSPQFTILDEKGHFAFPGVLPGTYTLIARKIGTARPSARLKIDIVDTDLEGVELPLSPGIRVVGELAYNDKDPHVIPAAQVSLYSLENLEYIRAAVTNNEFTFTNLPPCLYRVSLQPLPSGAYAKTLRVDGHDVPDWTVDLTTSLPHSISIVLGFDAGRVTGFARNASGDPLANMLVTLVPAGNSALTTPQFAIGTSDPQGRFMFSGVEPGAYKVFAWEKVNPGAIQNRETLRQFETKCADVQVQPNGTANADVTIISASATASIE